MSTMFEVKPTTDLIAQMRVATMPAHQRLDDLIMASDPFSSREAYRRLLTLQYCLQRDFEPLYHDDSLASFLPDLKSRSRLRLVEQDLADLQLAAPRDEKESLTLPLADLPASVGWLFVLEGSRLGAASLFKRAAALGLNEEFGARHLASSSDGPGHSWKMFVQAISAAPFHGAEQERAIAGSIAAFEHAANLAQRYVAEGREG